MTDLKTRRVLVTPTSYGQNDPRLKTDLEAAVGEVIYNTSGRPLTSAELMEVLPGCDGCIAGLDPFSREVFESTDRLKVVARYGVGVDAVDLEAAQEKGVIVTNTPGANSGAVAELAIGLMLALARQIPAAAVATRRGDWPRLTGFSIEGKIVGLIGFGSIGKIVARRLQGFDCRVWVYDPLVSVEMADRYQVEFKPLPSLISQADILSIHCPLLPETSGLVGTEFLSQMKPAAYLVNTARGEIIDETALLDGLERGLLRGAALDVFARQPPPPDHPLLHHPRVIATPHIGAQTDGAKDAMGWSSLKNCLAVLRGAEPENRVA